MDGSTGAGYHTIFSRPLILPLKWRLKASPKAQNKIKVWKVISADSVNNCAPLTQFLKEREKLSQAH